MTKKNEPPPVLFLTADLGVNIVFVSVFQNIGAVWEREGLFSFCIFLLTVCIKEVLF